MIPFVFGSRSPTMPCMLTDYRAIPILRINIMLMWAMLLQLYAVVGNSAGRVPAGGAATGPVIAKFDPLSRTWNQLSSQVSPTCSAR